MSQEMPFQPEFPQFDKEQEDRILYELFSVRFNDKMDDPKLFDDLGALNYYNDLLNDDTYQKVSYLLTPEQQDFINDLRTRSINYLLTHTDQNFKIIDQGFETHMNPSSYIGQSYEYINNLEQFEERGLLNNKESLLLKKYKKDLDGMIQEIE